MKRLLFLLTTFALSAIADVVPTVQWDVETGRLIPVPYALSIRRGESVNLEPRFLSYNSPMVLTGATVQLRYWYTGQTGYYATTGSLMAATGRVHIAWADALCPASNALNYEVRATIGTNVLARGYGGLTLLAGTSGAATNGQVYQAIDWGLLDQTGGRAILTNEVDGTTIIWTNGQLKAVSAIASETDPIWSAASNLYYRASNPSNYCTLAAAAALTNGLISATEGTNIAVAVIAPYTNHQSRTDNPHGVTAGQVGALPTGTVYVATEADTNALARLASHSNLVAFAAHPGTGSASTNNSGDFMAAGSGLTNETDTLATVTARGNRTTADLIVGITSANRARIGIDGSIGTATNSLSLGPYSASSGYTASGGAYVEIYGNEAGGAASKGTLLLSSGTGTNNGATIDFRSAGSTAALLRYGGTWDFKGNTLSNIVFGAGVDGSNLTGITAAQVGAVPTNDARYLASLTNITPAQVVAAGGLTNIVYYAGTTAYSSNGMAYVGTNSFGGGTSSGGGVYATNSVSAIVPVGNTGTVTAAASYWQWSLTNNSTLTATMTDFPTNMTSALGLSIYYGAFSLTPIQGTVFSASSVALLGTASTNTWNLYSITKGYGATNLTIQGPIQ